MISKTPIKLDDATYQFLLDDLWTSENPNSTWRAPEELSSAAGPVRKTKRQPRSRTIFTAQQLNYMEERFLQSPYIARLERIHLSLHIGVSEEAVKTWFQNRRARRNRQAASGRSSNPPESIPQQVPPSQYIVPHYNTWPNYFYHPYGVPQAPQVAPQPPMMY